MRPQNEQMDQKSNTPQEIDLIELFRQLSQWINKKVVALFTIGILLLHFIIRTSKWFILSLILGVTAGFIVHKISKPYYQSELICNTYTVQNTEIIQNINKNNYKSIFAEADRQQIKEIHATYLLDINKDGKWDVVEDYSTINTEDTSIIQQRLPGTLCIVSQVYDTALISKLGEKIITHIAKNERIVKQNDIRLRQQREMIPKLEQEIAALDSLKKLEYFQEKNQASAKIGEMVFMEEKETKLYHKEILSLSQQVQSLERQLFLQSKPLEVILNFTIPSDAVNNLKSNIKSSLAFALILGLFLTLYFDQRKFIQGVIARANKK